MQVSQKQLEQDSIKRILQLQQDNQSYEERLTTTQKQYDQLIKEQYVLNEDK